MLEPITKANAARPAKAAVMLAAERLRIAWKQRDELRMGREKYAG
jgi:hypothetical protein